MNSAGPKSVAIDSVTHYRFRKDRVDRFGRVTLRYLSRLRDIDLQKPLSATSPRYRGRVSPPRADPGPSREYQPLGGRKLVHDVVTCVRDVLRLDMSGKGGIPSRTSIQGPPEGYRLILN